MCGVTRASFNSNRSSCGIRVVVPFSTYWRRRCTRFASFEAVFMPYMLTADGRTLVERIAETGLLPPAEPSKVVPLLGQSNA